MDEPTRRNAVNDGRNHSNGVDADQGEDVSRRRESVREDHADDRSDGRPALTSREREERWPIG